MSRGVMLCHKTTLFFSENSQIDPFTCGSCYFYEHHILTLRGAAGEWIDPEDNTN